MSENRMPRNVVTVTRSLVAIVMKEAFMNLQPYMYIVV